MVGTGRSPVIELSEIVTNPPSGIVSVMELEISTPVVVDESVVMLEVGGLELEVAIVVDLAFAVLGGGVAGGTIGNVVFRAGHPEDLVSRRTGQAICRESMPFQTTAG